MTIEFSEQQRQALHRGEPVRFEDETIGEVVILAASAYQKTDAHQHERVDVAKAASKALDQWARENPYQP